MSATAIGRNPSWWENRTPAEKIDLLKGWIPAVQKEATDHRLPISFREQQARFAKELRHQLFEAELKMRDV